ncbi:uncharacterized protein C8Q71DRAFT_798821 [Rhodofomes roseus]|uniref:Uncharacterized protein n=1 Tax=Rhodofomes roseus TaxID=34475 RepID=A0ABQ8K499_9APHY|nr:uncharacterized protein C8Q71DRAFT_798821 [Rhodofomes roseus]KAH9831731.1 hypothetical protein C8Q71DRAFT_798821 [Rhodofomes roseus]
MTDFSSQGRTRPYNVVDLQNCKNHQSVYRCLSRGSTYQGTIIVQGFDNSKFMGGVTGWLRQEFRELELLDEITKLKYDGTLSPSVEGAKYMPKTMYSALKLSKKQPFDVEKPCKESQWEMVKRANKDKQPQLQKDPDSLAESSADTDPTNLTKHDLQTAKDVPAKGTTQLATVSNDIGSRTKRKHTAKDKSLQREVKRTHTSSMNIAGQEEPVCFTWNNETYSCAFDTLFGILHNIYREQNMIWEPDIKSQNAILTRFTELLEKNSTWPSIRDPDYGPMD